MRRPPWHLRESELAPEAAWLNRRALLRGLGFGALAAASGITPALAKGPKRPAAPPAPTEPVPTSFAWDLPTLERNPAYTLDRPLTDETVAASHNNFYELTTDKAGVWKIAHTLEPKPWTVEVSGLVNKPKTYDLGDLLKRMPIEERTYRFRCVEAWSMAVPWAGFPLKALLDEVEPLSSAKYVRMVTIDAPAMFPGVKSQPWYSWPFYEGLTMQEAMHELTLMAVGIYGHALPNQHGAPIRLITPWKYGYKQVKSIARIELVAKRPKTFWNDLAPDEYDFDGNVRPDIPHPRWSQAVERTIPTGEYRATLSYNGYADLVAGMYG